MVAFSSAVNAVGCAVGIQQELVAFNRTSGSPPLRVRIGLHTGTLLRDEDDFFGREVVVAARVSAAARGGEILVSDAVREAVGSGLLPLGEPRAAELKGLRGRHRLHPVVWDGARPQRSDAGSSRLYDRAAELEALTHALRGAREGSGGSIAVTGPAGIGKSALLSTLADVARAENVRVLRAQGFEIERAFPFGVVRELIGAAVQRLDPGTQTAIAAPAVLRALGVERPEPEQPAPPHELMAGMLRVLEELTGGSPTVLLIDDAQWVDDPSLDWLGYMSRRLAGRPLLLVLAVRDEESLPEPLRELLATGGVRRLQPRGLSEAATERLVRERLAGATPDFARACHAVTGGIPIYVHELLTAVREADVTPDRTGIEHLGAVSTGSVERLVVQRLARLGPAELAMARACATLDTRADLRSAGRIADLDPAEALAAADSLCAARLLEARRPLQFAHPIMRAAVAGAMTPQERSALHAAAARLLIADRAPAQEVAAHLLMVAPGEMPDAVQRFQAAAESALAEGAPKAAARFAERALDEAPSDTVPALLTLLARARLREADTASAVRLAERAVESGDDPVQRCRALVVLGQAMVQEILRPGSGFDWDPDGERVAEAIGRAAEDLGPEHRALRFELEALVVGMASSRASMLAVPFPPEAVSRLERLAAEADGDLPGEVEVRALMAGFQVVSGSAAADAAVALARRGLEGERHLEPESWASALEVLIACDAHAEAEQRLAAGARRAARLGSPLSGAFATVYRAWNALAAGDLDAAVAFHHDATELLTEVGRDAYLEACAGAVMCGVALLRGDLFAMRRYSQALEHPGLRDHTTGLLLLAEGDADGAAERLLATRRRLDRRGLWRTAGPLRPVRPDLAVALVGAGDIDEARAVADAEEEVARRFGSASCVAEALRAQAAALGEAGPLREAAQVARGCEARLVEAEVLVSLGRMTEGAEAERALTRGLGIAERRGATAIAERAREALASL